MCFQFSRRSGRLILLLATVLVAGSSKSQNRVPIPVKIDTIYGATAMEIGESDNYRVRLNPGADWPVQYYWDLGDGTLSVGNNIVHSYTKVGVYRVRVWARNRAGADSSTFFVHVAAPDPPAETPIIAAAGSDPTPKAPSASDRGRRSKPAPYVAGNGDQAFAWVMETHLDNASAERALEKYRNSGVPGVRVLIDGSGTGAKAYRVVIGNYLSLDSAARSKQAVEQMVERKVWLFAFTL